MATYYEMTKSLAKDVLNITRLGNFKHIIFGESHQGLHSKHLLKWILREQRPEYFLTEHLLFDSLLTQTAIIKRMGDIVNGKRDEAYNKYTMPWLETATTFHLKVIGIDYQPTGKTKIEMMEDFDRVVYRPKDLIQSFIQREKQMTKVCKEYMGKGNIVLQVGDTHLRATDEGKETIGNKSPLMDFVLSQPSTLIIRLPKHLQECK